MNEELRKPIPGYCYDIEVGDLPDCHKIIDGRCTVYADPCRKMGGGQMLGCAFSPLEAPVQASALDKKRIGQQKQAKKGKTDETGWYHKKGRHWKRG